MEDYETYRQKKLVRDVDLARIGADAEKKIRSQRIRNFFRFGMDGNVSGLGMNEILPFETQKEFVEKIADEEATRAIDAETKRRLIEAKDIITSKES